MKLLTYITDAGPRLAAVTAAGLVDIAAACEQARIEPPPDALAAAAAAGAGCAAAIEAAAAAGTAVVEEPVRIGVPIPRPGKIIALAANYPAHALEVGETVRDAATSVPHAFPKLPSSIAATGDPITIPAISDMVDYEVELAVVIGRTATRVAAAGALEHVAGYAVFNDVTARRVIFPNRPEPGPDDASWDFLYGKWCDGFAIVGPWFVTADEVPDPHALAMELRVNGAVRQSAVTGDMIFRIPETIAFLSSVCTLEPGDVIAMGTPAGIGEMGDGCLREGDVVEARIDGLGTQRNAVVGAVAPVAP